MRRRYAAAALLVAGCSSAPVSVAARDVTETGQAVTSSAQPTRLEPATKPRPRPSRSLTRASRSSTVRLPLDVTAYCATGSRTASGAWPREGMAAGNRWRFGTRLRVPGVGVVTVTDRIGWGSDLDLYFGDRAGCEQLADAFGRRRLLVEVLR